MRQPEILLYHPDTVELRVLTGMLRATGFTVFATSSVVEARHLLATRMVRVLVADGTQGKESLDLLAAVGARFSGVRRLLLVADDRNATARWILAEGYAEGLVRTPPRSIDLIGAVALALDDPAALLPASPSTDPDDEARRASGE